MQLATPDLLQQTAPELVQTLVRTLLDGPPVTSTSPATSTPAPATSTSSANSTPAPAI